MECHSAPAKSLPNGVEAMVQQGNKIDVENPPQCAKLRGQYGQLQQSKVRQVVVSEGMRCV